MMRPSRLFARACVLLAVALTLTTSLDAGGPAKLRGFAMAVWQRSAYDEVNVPRSLDEMKALGTRWVSLHATYYQDGLRVRTATPQRRWTNWAAPSALHTSAACKSC